MSNHFRDSETNLADIQLPTPRAKSAVPSPNFREVEPQFRHAVTELHTQLQRVVTKPQLQNAVVEPRPDLRVTEPQAQLQHAMAKPQLQQNVVSEAQPHHAAVEHSPPPPNLNFDDAFLDDITSIVSSALPAPSKLNFDFFDGGTSSVLPISPAKSSINSFVPAPSSALVNVR